VPYTVALVVVGLLVGSLHIIEPPALTKQLLFAVFLPGLIFEAAYNIHATELRRSWRAVTILAGPGVIAAIIVAGFAIAWALRATGFEPSFSWRDGLVFAALVSATDPVAVVSLFRKLGLDARLTTLVEAESLFNDGTSIVALTLILAFVGGDASSIAGLVVRFVLVVCGGAAIGAALGYAIVRVTRHLDDPMIEITLTTIAAYASFLIAERLGASGIISTLAAGLMIGSAGTRFLSRAGLDRVHWAWEYFAFLANSLVFILIGMSVASQPIHRLGSSAAAVAILLVLAGRALSIYPLSALFSRSRWKLRAPLQHTLFWGGLRGALALALALAVPAEVPERSAIILTAFVVVAFSILVQGLTMPWLVNRLQLGRKRSAAPVAAPATES
jgi:CPA1 family monovalent cation:H+ antiporter